jgi:hypothetical protein
MSSYSKFANLGFEEYVEVLQNDSRESCCGMLRVVVVLCGLSSHHLDYQENDSFTLPPDGLNHSLYLGSLGLHEILRLSR